MDLEHKDWPEPFNFTEWCKVLEEGLRKLAEDLLEEAKKLNDKSER